MAKKQHSPLRKPEFEESPSQTSTKKVLRRSSLFSNRLDDLLLDSKLTLGSVMPSTALMDFQLDCLCLFTCFPSIEYSSFTICFPFPPLSSSSLRDPNSEDTTLTQLVHFSFSRRCSVFAVRFAYHRRRIRLIHHTIRHSLTHSVDNVCNQRKKQRKQKGIKQRQKRNK